MSYKIRTILIAVADPSARAGKAVSRGVEIARRTGARIELFNAVALTGSYGDISRAESREFARLLRERAMAGLHKLARRLRRESLEVEVHAELGYPFSDAIVERVRRSRPDLVVIEAHRHTVFARLLLSQTDYGLIRDCPVPLLIVKSGRLPARPLALAALDPWHAAGKPAGLDARILDVARGMAAVFNGSVHTAYVYAPLVGFVAGAVGAPSSIPVSLPDDRRYKAAVSRQFRRVNRRHGIGARNTHLRSGDPATELPYLARTLQAGMVVMGAVSRSAIKRLFIGNTAERVLDALSCDVLIVKPAKARA